MQILCKFMFIIRCVQLFYLFNVIQSVAVMSQIVILTPDCQLRLFHVTPQSEKLPLE